MKKETARGKKYKMKHDRFSIEYGSPVNRNISSFYISVNTWIAPEETITARTLTNLSKTIRQTIWNNLDSNGLVLRNKTISEFKFPDRHVIESNRMYVSFDTTIFINQKTPIDSPVVKETVAGIADSIINTFDTAENIKYFKTKK